MQPQDERRDDALAAAGKIMRTDDPAGKLRELIDKELAEQDRETARNLEQFRSLFALDDLGPLTGSFQADGDGLALDTVMTRDAGRAAPHARGAVVGAVAASCSASCHTTPGARSSCRSWARRPNRWSPPSGGALGGAAITGQVKGSTGLDLQREVFSWIGDAGLFVRGTTAASVDGALVISATDEDRAATAFGRIVGLIGKQTGRHRCRSRSTAPMRRSRSPRRTPTSGSCSRAGKPGSSPPTGPRGR